MTERTSDTGAAMSPPPAPAPGERPARGSGAAPPPDADSPGTPATRGKSGAPAKPPSTRRPRSAAKRAAKPRAKPPATAQTAAPVRHDPAHGHGPAPAPTPAVPAVPAVPAAVAGAPAPAPAAEGGETFLHPAAVPDPEAATQAATEAPAEAPAEATEAAPPRPAHPLFRTPGEAFDALYAAHSTALVQQTYLLTGRQRLAKEAVERAFHLAWQRWPEVATDADPAGWLRAAAHEYALSPWHRFRLAHRRPDRPPADPGLRTLLRALLDLPPRHRRTLLLYDGLGLDLPETAAETEASTPAAANRLLHAREALIARVPELAAAADPEALSELLRRRIGELALAEPQAVAWLSEPQHVRTGGERRNRVWTRATVTLTAVIAGATAFTLSTAPTHYIPSIAPGQRIGDVPLNSGPQRQGEEDEELHRKLLEKPAHGPERLVPESR